MLFSPSNEAQSEVRPIMDLLHRRKNQLLQTGFGVGAFGHDVYLQRDVMCVVFAMETGKIRSTYPSVTQRGKVV